MSAFEVIQARIREFQSWPPETQVACAALVFRGEGPKEPPKPEVFDHHNKRWSAAEVQALMVIAMKGDYAAAWEEASKQFHRMPKSCRNMWVRETHRRKTLREKGQLL